MGADIVDNKEESCQQLYMIISEKNIGYFLQVNEDVNAIENLKMNIILDHFCNLN